MKDIIIEEIIRKKTIEFGNSSHVILSKNHLGKIVYVLIVAKDSTKPYIHWDNIKKHDGKNYVKAEITDNAGTHGLWIEKKLAKKMFTRN